MATASRGQEVTLRDSGGWFDLGMVYNPDKGANTPKSPEYPGNFTCG